MPDTPPLIAAAFDDRYLIDREIGAGGMAIVYLARDRKLDREVALKVLRPELGAVLGSERFLAEIRISARLDHPHILTLIDSGAADGFLYYVMPYVRGESLRTKLDREHQLGIDEALSITKHVASALDYAHRQGLVHRDIKPENILIQEGEPMLTDFGIALAVSEAGGNRLTQTGLSLGTPQYMSPEQATGDRRVDARSDVYSLAAVLYEMLAGEPPVSGASAQSMIAKLMTEKPTHLRVLRDSIPLNVDEAVARALSKTPADRFASAGEFMKSLERAPEKEAAQAATSRRRNLVLGGLAAVVALGAVGAFVTLRTSATEGERAVLGERRQLTVSGQVLRPAISPDGKQLAYITKQCGTGRCSFSVVVQDVGGSASRAILEGARVADKLIWSPDRRNLAFQGAIGTRYGTWLLSALGGTPRFLVSGPAAFYAGGDSLILAPTYSPDSVFWLRVTSLEGVVRDSIRIGGRGEGLGGISVVPGTTWILTRINQSPRGLWQLVDRTGKVLDRVVNDCTCGGVATSDAVWLAQSGENVGQSIIRIPIDRRTGRLSSRQDTMLTALFTDFSITEDGSAMVMDDGTYSFKVWALETAVLLKGRFQENRQIASASSEVSGDLSPDGTRILIRRLLPTGGGRAERRYTVAPFGGGQEAPSDALGGPQAAYWSDTVTVAAFTRTPKGRHFFQQDVRSGARRNLMDLPDSPVRAFQALDEGWAWIPAGRDKLMIRQRERTREIPLPPWYASVGRIAADPQRDRVFFTGRSRSAVDSNGVGVISLSDASYREWGKLVGRPVYLKALADGSAFLAVEETQESLTFYRLIAPGNFQLLGTSPRPLLGVAVSADLKRVVAVERDYRADAWLTKVVRPDE